MSLYSDYIKEHEDREAIETDSGFVFFKIAGKECYIQEIYIIPEKRRLNIASDLANKVTIIAKERGCEYLVGSVVPTANKSTESTKTLLTYGFKLLRSEPNLIWFIKKVE